MRSCVLALVVGCAAARPPAGVADGPLALPPDQIRYYTIWLGGARVGTAVETETWSRAGVHLRRAETMQFLRVTTEVEIATTIDVDADAALRPSRVAWSETSGDHQRRAEAVRTGDAWHANDPAIAIAPDALPSELVPLVVRRDHHFSGNVFLPARGFIGGAGRIDPVAPGRWIARLAFAVGPVAEATIDLDRDGSPSRVVDGEGVIEIRATRGEAFAAYPITDLIAATAVPIGGVARTHASRIRHLLLDGDLALPPLPGQAMTPSATGIAIDLGAQLPGDLPAGDAGRDRAAEIRTLVARVRARIVPSLGASLAAPRDIAAATAGDCTTFALAYAAVAAESGIPTRVVTGLRVDGDRLVRHRWAVSWTGRAWIAVDAAFGAAPAGGDLIGLAVHDADDAGLVAGDAALVQVRSAAWN